jgi:glucosamine--fructose-6-phosphate aminotransferase (isomerizing)
MLIASDAAALVRHTSQRGASRRRRTGDRDRRGASTTFDREANDTGREPVEIEVAAAEWELTGHQHYMYKEIQEQPEKAAAVIGGRLDDRFATARLNGLNLARASCGPSAG